MDILWFVYLFCVVAVTPSEALFGGGNGGESEEESDWSSGSEEDLPPPKETCPASPLGGIKWILHIRNEDYGWKENTHRAVIALVVSDWKSFTKANERRLMEQQLEVELTKALLRNHSSPIYPNNLALYINALIAVNKNPRDFHGIDLVAHLLHMIHSSSYAAHPFLLLALCNAKSLDRYHLDILEYYLRNHQTSKQNIEYKALALQAYECAGTLNHQINDSVVTSTQKYLSSQQYPDGSFGNVYTTALIVQALSASNLKWDKEKAIKYLQKQSVLEVNMVSSYLIQLALNAEKCRFIKDLHPELFMGHIQIKKHKDNFVQYSLKIGPHPDVHHTISINVPPGSNFFQIMKLCAENDPKYNFSYYMNKNNEPSVYMISGIPNDAEESFYWRLCLQTDIDHNRHRSKTTSIRHSPAQLWPQPYDHVMYWYNDKDCEEQL